MPPIFRGAPGHDQRDVPTDVVPVYELSALYGLPRSNDFPAQFTLRTAAGASVAITTEPAAMYHVALRPVTALEPHTQYVLEATSADDAEPLSLAFTTGAGPLPPGKPPALAPAALHYWLSPNGANSGACDFWGTGACASLPEGELIEVVFPATGALEQTSYPYDRPLLVNGPFELGVPDEHLGSTTLCLEARRRALNGVLGAPTVVCGSDSPIARLSGDGRPICTTDGVAASEGGVTLTALDDPTPLEDSNPLIDERTSELGCSLGSAPRRSTGAPLALLALAAFARHVWRRAPKRRAR